MSCRTWKDKLEKKPWLSFSQIWPSAHIGRYYKKRLSKLRRRYWDLDNGHTRGLYGAMSECNWKGW